MKTAFIGFVFCILSGVAAGAERLAVVDEEKAPAGLYTVSGAAMPEGANAWFEPTSGRLTRFDGSAVDNYLTSRYGIDYRPINPNLNFKSPPVGWMTWYAVKFDASDAVVMRNARDFMAKFRGYTDEKPVLWVDWEWFHGRLEQRCGDFDTDMLSPRKEVYPRGLKPVADDLKALGFTPALWVSVFSDVRTNAMWKAHPEWILGEKLTWCGAIGANPCAPGFCEEYVPYVFSLYKGWGYEAFKWDTVPVGYERFGHFRKLGRKVDPPRETLRRCARAVRKAVGENCYVMSCSGEIDEVNLAAIDIFDGGRIGGDIFSWTDFRKWGVERILSYLPFHNTVFWSDADNLVLRREFSSEAQARTRVTIYALAGVPITLGDEISALDETRIDMLRRAMPVVKMRAASLSRGTSVPDLLPLRTDVVRDFGRWQLRGWSNLTTNRTLSAELKVKDSVVWDFWNDRLVGEVRGERVFPVSVAPGDTALYRVTPLEKGAPTLVSVSRHVTQGGYEIADYAADAAGVRGTVRCPGGETVKVTLLLPEGTGVVSASHPYEVEGRLVRIALHSDARRDVRIELKLGVRPIAASPAAQLFRDLKAMTDSPALEFVWTHAWMNPWAGDGDKRFVTNVNGRIAAKPLSEIRLANRICEETGVAPRLYYSDLAGIVGSWHRDEYYDINRKGFAQVIRKAWRDYRGVCVFSWHMDHPCTTNGFYHASYRYKCAEHRNVIKAILDDERWECGLGQIKGPARKVVFASPRHWFIAQLEEVARFVNSLNDENGKPIPVIIRYPHEMDGAWFWWGDTWCTPAEFIAFCRFEADTLRRLCGRDRILFAYDPDKCWQELGAPDDGKKNFLTWYPGDEYADIVGFDDYSIGLGNNDRDADNKEKETIRRLRIVSAFASEHGKIAALTETGINKPTRNDFYERLYRILTADGVRVAFVDTWGGEYTMPLKRPVIVESFKRFLKHPEVLTKRFIKSEK